MLKRFESTDTFVFVLFFATRINVFIRSFSKQLYNNCKKYINKQFDFIEGGKLKYEFYHIVYIGDLTSSPKNVKVCLIYKPVLVSMEHKARCKAEWQHQSFSLYGEKKKNQWK